VVEVYCLESKGRCCHDALLLLVSLALLLFGAAMYVADIGPNHWLWIAAMTVGAGLRPGSWSPTGFHPTALKYLDLWPWVSDSWLMVTGWPQVDCGSVMVPGSA